MTVADGVGTLETETPAGLRSTPVLSPAQAGELGRVGLSIEELYGEPVDVEWARAGGEVVGAPGQAGHRSCGRAATSAVADPGDQWNDSLAGDYLWTNGNLGEALPDVMTPATWSFIELLMSRMIFPPSVRDYRGYGRIGGRFYANVSVSMSLEALIGISSRRFVALFGPVLGRLPSLDEIPRAQLPRWKASRLMVPATFAMVRRVNANAKRLPQFLADSPARCDRLRAADRADRHGGGAGRPVAEPGAAAAGRGGRHAHRGRLGGRHHARLHSRQAGGAGRRGGRRPAAVRPAGRGTEGTSLASLGPVVGLARLARGDLDRDVYVRQYGHRGAHEMELSIPRPAEDPGWPDDLLAALPVTVATPPATPPETLTRCWRGRTQARAAAWQRLAGSDPWKARRCASSSCAGRRSPAAARRPDPRSSGRCGWRGPGCGGPGS